MSCGLLAVWMIVLLILAKLPVRTSFSAEPTLLIVWRSLADVLTTFL